MRVSLLDRPSVPEIAGADRIAFGPRSVAVVDALPGAPIGAAIADAAARSGLRVRRVRIRLRTTPGHELLGEGEIASHPDAILDAARVLAASVDPMELVVLEGAPLFAAAEARVSILATLSPSLTALDADVRALRDRFDLVLYDARPGVIDRLVHSLA